LSEVALCDRAVCGGGVAAGAGAGAFWTVSSGMGGTGGRSTKLKTGPYRRAGPAGTQQN